MPAYRVRWEFDINADTPQEAACKARVAITKEDSTATCFEVFDGDVALNEERQRQLTADTSFIAEFDVRWTPSFPFAKAHTIEEAEALDATEIHADPNGRDQ